MSGGAGKGGKVTDVNASGNQKMGARTAVQGIVDEKAVLPSFPKSDIVKARILKAMSENTLFTMVDEATRLKIVDTMQLVQYEPNQVVILQGDAKAERFFVLEEGLCEVYKKETGLPSKADRGPKLDVTYGPGNSFGELALMYSAPRAATVVAVQSTVAWAMERQHYMMLKREYFQMMYKEKMQLLDKVPCFNILNESQMDLLLDAMESTTFKAEANIITQGEQGHEFFIISEGRVAIKVDGKLVNRLSPGAFFGERALMKDELRAADVIAIDDVTCMKLDRKDFVEIFGSMEKLLKLSNIQKVPMLCTLKEEELMKLVGVSDEIKYSDGDIVYNKGETSESMYILSEGTITITNPDDEEHGRVMETLVAGDYFGEKALLRNVVRPQTATCVGDCTLLVLTHTSLTTNLGSLEDLQMRWREGILEKVEIFKALNKKQRHQLSRVLVGKSVKDQEGIVTKGESGDTFFIIESGTVKVLAADGVSVLTTLKQGDFFGERALITNEVRNATVEADGIVQVLMVDRKTFTDMLGDSKALFQQCLAEREATDNDMKVQMGDLKTVAVLGIGAFGRVTLVKHHKAFYALKAINKHYVVEKNMLAHVVREKETMSELNSAFTVNLVASLQDKDNIYMMMERVMGGEFFFFLHNLERPLHEQHCRFYAACVIQGMSHIHAKGYMFRDLKPENLLLDQTGYLKITDYGFAKKLKKGKSYTLCGTPDYLAPEIIQQTGHNHAVDWWAVGVLIFEICTRSTPFAAPDQLKILFNINNLAINWGPAQNMSSPCKDLISKFLVKNPAHRYGVIKGGEAKIKAHPWFVGFDWEALENRTLKPPYVPDLKGPEDTSMFEQMAADIEVPGASDKWSAETLAAVANPNTFGDW